MGFIDLFVVCDYLNICLTLFNLVKSQIRLIDLENKISSKLTWEYKIYVVDEGQILRVSDISGFRTVHITHLQ